MLVMINNQFVSAQEATLPITQDLLLGFGIFETMRTFGEKKLCRLEDHLERLFTSAKKINLPIDYTMEEVKEMLKKVVDKSNDNQQRIKIVAIPNTLIIISKELILDENIYNGVSCLSVECVRTLPEIKSISYLPCLLANKKAKEEGCFDAILVDDNGDVYEGAYSNIFWFEGDILCTRKDDVLPGITRKAIIEISPFRTQYKTIDIKDIYKKDEVFLTSSIRGIVPITQIDNHQIGNGMPGKNTQKLSKILKTHINETIGS